MRTHRVTGLIELITKFRAKKTRVFLGGTEGTSKWREELIPLLTVDYFDPSKKTWYPDDCELIDHEKEICTDIVYVITPKQVGFYTIAELIESKYNDRGQHTTLVVLEEDDGVLWSPEQRLHVNLIKTLFKQSNKKTTVLDNLPILAAFLNGELF